MKNRKTAWILLPGVLLIWGFLGWKLYAALKSDVSMEVTNSVPAPPTAEKPIVPDTYQLLLDYPDPFLSTTKPVVKNASGTNHNVPKAPIKKNEPISAPAWPDIRYSGLVKSPKDGKMVGFLSLDGNSNFVKNGDVIGAITVRNIWKDSVLVGFGKELRVIRK